MRIRKCRRAFGGRYSLFGPQVFEKNKRNPSEILRSFMAVPDKELFEFGSFRIDPAEHLLLCDGEPVPLEPKVFETLLA
jgi:DNA-binding response OmpR family regulator